MMARLKEREDENRRLKKMYAEERSISEIIQNAMQKSKDISIRVACSTFGLSESGYRYCAKLRDENVQIANWLTDLTARHRY